MSRTCRCISTCPLTLQHPVFVPGNSCGLTSGISVSLPYHLQHCCLYTMWQTIENPIRDLAKRKQWSCEASPERASKPCCKVTAMLPPAERNMQRRALQFFALDRISVSVALFVQSVFLNECWLQCFWAFGIVAAKKRCTRVSFSMWQLASGQICAGQSLAASAFCSKKTQRENSTEVMCLQSSHLQLQLLSCPLDILL